MARRPRYHYEWRALCHKVGIDHVAADEILTRHGWDGGDVIDRLVWIDAYAKIAVQVGRLRAAEQEERRQERERRIAEARAEEQRIREEREAARRQAMMPTERQIEYALALIEQRKRIGDLDRMLYQGPRDRAGLERMSRRAISAYIDALKRPAWWPR